MVRSKGEVAGRSSSNAVSAPKPDQQRRRIFGKKLKASTKNKEEQGQHRFANGVWYRVTTWFWRTNTTTPNQGGGRIGRRARGSHHAGVARDTNGWMPKRDTVIVMLPLLVVAAATTFFLMRYFKLFLIILVIVSNVVRGKFRGIRFSLLSIFLL